MIVRQIGAGEIAPAIQLIWDTFLQFEAPDYSNEGVRAFRSFIENREIVASLEFFGAYENGQLRGVLATNAHRRHICCFVQVLRFSHNAVFRPDSLATLCRRISFETVVGSFSMNRAISLNFIRRSNACSM